MRIYGERNMPGAGGNLAGTPSFQIGPRSPFKGMSQEELNKLKEWDSRPGELQKYYEQQNRPGPSLPFANLPGAIGNMGGLLLAQLPPAGGMLAQASFLHFKILLSFLKVLSNSSIKWKKTLGNSKLIVLSTLACIPSVMFIELLSFN